MSLTLWQKIQQDDLAAFDEFYHLYIAGLYDYGMSIAKRQDIVDESIQLLFTKLYQKRKDISIKSAPKAYLFTTLRRLIIEQLGKQNSHEEIDFHNEFQFSEGSHEDRIVAKDKKSEDIDKLNEAKKHLTKRQKEIVFLKFNEELSYDEISVVMNITKDAAYKLVNQAIKRLTENF
jgi:RNA polymerase sigma-70 factor (ECF subfamily)